MARSRRLSSASAYFRNAAKAERAGNRQQADHFRAMAERLVREDQRERDARARRK